MHVVSWENIVSTHGEALFRSAFRILHQADDAEDVTQEVLLEAFRKLQREGRLPDAPLLRRMATLRAIDRLRVRRSNESLDRVDLADGPTMERDAARWVSSSSTAGPGDRMEREEQSERLRQAIARLPRQQAHCFALRYIEGLSNREIAESTDLSTTAVSTTLSRARRNLRAHLEPACDMGEMR